VSVVLDTAVAFVNLTVQVLPWFAIGVLTAALMQTFVPASWATGALSGRRGLPVAITAGAVLPGCSCTTMPLAIGLREITGPRVGTLTAFIFVSPLLSPITVALTLSLLGWEMTVARVVAAIAGSAIIGLIINRFEPRFEPGPLPPMAGASPEYDDACNREGCCESDATSRPAWRRLLSNSLNVAHGIGLYFVVGMLAAAVLTTAVPEDAIPNLLGGSSGLAAFALAAVIGIPLYVCEGEEVPLTYGLVTAGLGQGPAFTFLLGSVGTCVPTVLMARGIIGARATHFYLGFWIGFAALAGIAFGALVG
jgi:uncharacterized membrane protein YraQ (UPF0718 family)